MSWFGLFIAAWLCCATTKAQTSAITPSSTTPHPSNSFVLVELNCENLFDTRHDDGKDDVEFTPDGVRRWTRTKYWRKLNTIGQELLSCADELPDLVALVEVENDSVLHDLTRRSLLRNAGYNYLITCSPDVRGLDVALLYQPMRFRPLCYDELPVEPLPHMRPTRSILYVQGETQHGDTLHLYVVHAPSRYGGELETRPFRRRVVSMLSEAMSTLPADALVIVAGDFNDYADSPSLRMLTSCDHPLQNVSACSRGRYGHALATYRFQGEWKSIDHILVSGPLVDSVDTVYINDSPFLLEKEPVYGGMKPRRTFLGYRYQRGGFSDHLPLVMKFRH
ncbi:MAG: endonuclease/exonuclease/phosphatase family protein [Prevotella sp.]|nr:endonuclease/exonuclease/phosphatase family protein [Prevotella sp.]